MLLEYKCPSRKHVKGERPCKYVQGGNWCNKVAHFSEDFCELHSKTVRGTVDKLLNLNSLYLKYPKGELNEHFVILTFSLRLFT